MMLIVFSVGPTATPLEILQRLFCSLPLQYFQPLCNFDGDLLAKMCEVYCGFELSSFKRTKTAWRFSSFVTVSVDMFHLNAENRFLV